MMLTIIGSGLAGYTLVREIRKLDKDIPIKVITADNGDYYSKPQLSNALSNHKTPEQLVLIPAEKFAAQFNIELVVNTKLLPSLWGKVGMGGEIIFATGAKAVTPHPPFGHLPPQGGKGLPQSEKREIYSVNNLQDYQYFRKAIAVENEQIPQKQVTIIGAGLVGCEFANDLINADYKVTIIAPEKYPLARLVPEEIGLSLKKALEDKGVVWRLGELFDLSSASPSQDNILLSAIGLKPEITLAQDMGIKTNRGIIVDQYLQTNQENIYALGDCMEFEGKLLPYIAPIAIAARALAKTLLGEPTPVIYPPMPIYIKTPAYPIVVLQADNSAEGEWQIEKADDSIGSVRALFYDKKNKNKLKGFALGGAFAAEAVDWLKQA